ncbi:MAG TPA: pyruvate dehydrogenase (acetyl-transferring), homodimeric type, partial [Gammaproteobacteria bacterium]|nr:pyruvate dehydrogenase (acetyl-transferring), homodimeric type [Gammaproteobacteria bacterium]
EARTFGMQTLFHQIGIYSPHGQNYEPEDAGSIVSYKEASDGQLLEEGISEAGAISSWTAAATAYSVHNIELLPVYIYYSMFGFQRIGDLIWAAADQRSRGFLFGATAGRTTLSGEGLQHQDGSSHLIAGTIPNCRAYDPCFAYELAVIIEYGIQRMFDDKRDEFFYVTLMNENYSHPSLPTGIEDDIVRGLYHYGSLGDTSSPRVRLLGSGTILQQVIKAAALVNEHFNVCCDIYSVTSFSELARDAQTNERARRLEGSKGTSQIDKYLSGSAPIVCATDYVRAVPAQISPYLEAPFRVLGTDGFGRSADRKSLREFFEIDAPQIAFTAVTSLIDAKLLPRTARDAAVQAFGINTERLRTVPWER